MIGIILGITALVVPILVSSIGYIRRTRIRLRTYYATTWEKSSCLKPEEVMGQRPFDAYYYERPEDELISQSLNDGENVLVVGPPLSGKTRAVYQAVVNLSRPHDVIVPRCTDIDFETFLFPGRLGSRRPGIIIVDDLHRFVEHQNFSHLLAVSMQAATVVVATCRSGQEYKKAKRKMLENGMDLEATFAIVELGKVSDRVGKEIADRVRISWDRVKFDGTVGSIFMRLREMEKRFDESNNVEKTIMRAMRSLSICGIYEGDYVFPLEWVKTAAKKDQLEGKDFEWLGWLQGLSDREFITLEKDRVRAEEAYLEYIFKPKAEMSHSDAFEENISVFARVPDALFRLGRRAIMIGSVALEKTKYLNTAIKAYNRALEIYTFEHSPMDYAMAKNNLALAYIRLSEVEGSTETCKKAVEALQEALRVHTLRRFPLAYAVAQNNRGTAYFALARLEDDVEYLRKAIEACKEALGVRTLQRFLPMVWVAARVNLGVAYCDLAEADTEHRAESCKMGIKALEEALESQTLRLFPRNYAAAQIDLAGGYFTLAKAEDKTKNLKTALKTYRQALSICTLDQLPTLYATTYNCLGQNYTKLAEVEDIAENCRAAIACFRKALEINTFERFPIGYADSQQGLGDTYCLLAGVDDRVRNCKKAIEACQQALRVYTTDGFQRKYGITQGTLGNAYGKLAAVEDKAENCKRAIKACEEAVRVLEKEKFAEIRKPIERSLREFSSLCRDALE